MPRFPLYLTQDEVDALALLLYRHQHLMDILAPVHPSDDRAFRMLSGLRRQCCDRSGAADPFPDLPHVPGMFESFQQKRRRA